MNAFRYLVFLCVTDLIAAPVLSSSITTGLLTAPMSPSNITTANLTQADLLQGAVFGNATKGPDNNGENEEGMSAANDNSQKLFKTIESHITGSKSIILLQEAEMQRRKSHIENVCSSKKALIHVHTDSRSKLLINRRRKISMCYVAKAGCTFWKRIFLKLQENQPERPDQFWFSVHKKFVHNSVIDNLQAMTFDQSFQFLKSSKKILFVRNPFSRLFSAYLDKFVLSDGWNPIGTILIRKLRPNPGPVSLKCGHDITFNEFLKFVWTFRNSSSEGFAEHWLPASKLCNPCSIDFDYVGKQETFGADLDFVLTQLKLRDELSVNVTKDSVALTSMAQSTSLMWTNLLNSDIQCQTAVDKLSRLWNAFVAQGFLPSGVILPWRNHKTVSMSEFLSFVQRTYKKQNLTEKTFIHRRRDALLAAYNSIPAQTLDNIRYMFSMDFALFDYSIWP
ncbi:carbohydrate sulfotransferase 11-like [Liolophura sinensis]|uniref:carbohydrate sulfotransferase 11-like n=1 Tax=Liolophura sinensis TaxID=3198878 RepID=UPI003158BDAB